MNDFILLATTAIEKTWGLSENILFLGEWCRLYERRHVWGQRNHEVVPFHWDDRNKLRRDYDDLQSLHHSLLHCFSSSLNRLHHVEYSVRYWQILLDPWLMSYVAVVFDRWECLRLAFEQFENIEVILPVEPAVAKPTFSYMEYIEEVMLDEWNQSLCQRIIENQYGDHCFIRRQNGLVGNKVPSREKSIQYQGILQKLALNADRFLGKLFTRYDVVFLNSYFKFISLVQLNLAIGQVPRVFAKEFKLGEPFCDFSQLSVNQTSRSSLCSEFEPKSSFEKFLVQSIVCDMPFCLVEGYQALCDQVNNLPIKTKAIVTANSHWGDVVAKTWMAEQTRKGVKLVIVEHGGSLAPYKALFDFEEDISDVKCTWFLPHHAKHKRLPPGKLINRFTQTSAKNVESHSRQYCSVIGSEQMRWVIRANFYPMAAQCLVSIDLVSQLYEKLNEIVQQAFRIKPYYLNVGWNTWQRYSDIFGPECIHSEKNLDCVFDVSKLVICTYPETTFSEAMASGAPTILFYPAYLNELNPVALPLLEILRSANIVFEDPLAAAAHINSVWSDPFQWWNSEAVLSAREEFRRQATDLDSDWLREWTTFIKSVIADPNVKK